MTTYDEAGSIGKRYRRQDAIGTPYCITIDDETMKNNTVTIRNRDTMEQITLPMDDVIGRSSLQRTIRFLITPEGICREMDSSV